MEAEVINTLERLASRLGREMVRAATAVEVPCDRPPWVDTGLHLEAGERITSLAAGRARLRGTDIAVGPSFQLWFRIGDRGEIFRGTRDSHTFTAGSAGTLYLASGFPGEWGTRRGDLGVSGAVYAAAEGALSVLLVRWSCEPLAGLHALADLGDPSGLVTMEIDRLTNPVHPPEGWYYLWHLGPAEIYRTVEVPGRRNAIACRTQGDCGLLLRDVSLPLEPGTLLRWSWKVDALPSQHPENTLPAHDYTSIAVEFENGQDLSYFWSAGLDVGTAFHCPIPLWRRRETHVVIRSGSGLLGEWLDEERDLYADHVSYVGGPAGTRIVRVWLIALSLYQRRAGVSTFADITLTDAAGDVITI